MNRHRKTRDAHRRGVISLTSWLLLGFIVPVGLIPLKATELLTERYDNGRTGQNQSETALTLQNVKVSSFGKLFSLPTDGQVYTQPLYKSQLAVPNLGTRNVVYVGTEHGSVYAFDADGNNPAQGYIWKVSFINPANGVTPVLPTDVGAGDISPEMVITGTPVIDPSSNTIYVVAQTKEVNGGTTSFVFRLHALDLATGAEKMNGPVVIKASVPGTGTGSVSGTLSFSGLWENQRAGLALVNGVVYIAWGSHGDQGPYHGWVIGYSASNIQQQKGVFVASPNNGGGGIWMSGGAISVDASGSLFVAAGNGNFNPSQQDFSDTALRLSTANGLTIADSFTPTTQQTMEFTDNDMGVSDAVLLPDQPGVFPHLLVTADKHGAIYLVNRDNFGGYNASTNASIQILQLGSSIHNSFSYFNGSVYVGGDGLPLEAFALQNGLLSGAPHSVTANTFGQNASAKSGTSPVISSNGLSDGIVWTLNNFNGAAVLYAYDAANLGNMLYNSTQSGSRDVAGQGVKFTTPSVVNGKVYVPGANTVTVYGLLSGAVQTTAAPTFNPSPGTIFNAPQSVTLSDSTPGATIYYTTDGTAPSLSSPTYSFPLSITGPTTINAMATAPGFSGSPTVSAFYTVQSASTPLIPTFNNGFTNSGLALNGNASIVGTNLELTSGAAGEVSSAFYTTPVNVQHFSTQFLFKLTNPNGEGFTFTIQNAGLNALGSPGGGLGYGPDPNYHVSSYERSISNSIAVKFDLADTSGEGIDSTGLYQNGASPAIPSIDLSGSGIDLHSGDIFMARLDYGGSSLTLTITDTNTGKSFSTTFTVDIPATIGSSTAYVGFTGSTGTSTATQDILQWTFNPLPYYPAAFTGSGLILNGFASVAGTRLQLTDGSSNEAASAFYATPVGIQHFTTQFLFQLLNAQADGFTFLIQGSGPNALGASGGGLGSENVRNSVAVKFDIYNNAGEGTSSTGIYLNGAVPTIPATDLLSHGIDLHSGDTFKAQLDYDGVNLTLTITDTNTGKTFTTAFPVNIPSTVGATTAYVGFTGGAGGLSATQQILQWTFSMTPAATTGTTALPVFNPPGGTVLNGPQSVSLSDATPSSTIYYTLDGSAPTTSSAIYSSPVLISSATTIKAFATAPGLTASPVVSASYTVQASPGVTAAPVFTPAGGTVFTSPQTVALSDSTSGAIIYYTVNGSAPTTSSTIYSSPILISSATTIKAFAIAPGFTASTLVSASYTVQTAPPPSVIDFGKGFTSTGLVLNGFASLVSTRLQLTNGGSNEAASAYYAMPVGIQHFTTQFLFQLLNAQADGFTFMIQGSGPNALGSSGGGLGSENVRKSVAVKFDIYNNAGEGTSSTGIYLNGAVPTIPATDLLSHSINLRSSDTFKAQLDYDGVNLTLTITDTNTAKTFTTAFPINIPSTVGATTAYVGFTGGAGGLSATQQIQQWTFTVLQ